MNAEILKFKKTDDDYQLRCTKCGATTDAPCDCGVKYELVNAAEAAKRGLKENPGLGNRALAKKIGVSHETVRRARSVDTNVSTEKRTGSDGKRYKSSKPQQSKQGRRGHVQSPQLDKARAIVGPLLDSKRPMSPHKLQDEHGISHVTFDMAITAELARREAFAELEVDPTTLSMTAQQKINSVLRQEKQRLDLEYQQKLRNEIDFHIKRLKTEQLPKWQEDARKARISAESYQKMINNHKPPLTEEQYRLILKCCHPDNPATTQMREQATALLNNKTLRLRLTGKE